ncbi:MAG TPA: hypothetical protein VFZ79_08790 [Acidimicrobiales bacterium]
MPRPITLKGALDEARSAIERGEWERALRMCTEGDDATSRSEVLELRAQASYGAGDLEGCVAAWEELHRLAESTGERAGAARAGAMVALFLMMDTGLMSPVRGWLLRSERLLDGAEELPAHAVIAMVRTYERFMCGDMAAARVEAERAIDLGGRLGVQPAVVIGRVATARVRILDGEVDEGIALLDEVAALLMSGDVDPLTTGMMYCELICAAQGLALHDRAAEWTDVMERWRHGAAFGGINGRCRVHRAELLRMSGPCDVAEAEALRACEELRPWMRREFGWPLVELGTIRLRRGDLPGAEDAFLAAHDHAWSPQPGLALLRLEQGDPVAAASLVADAIAHPFDIPSKERPPFGELRLAPLLEAQVEIASVTGEIDTARAAVEVLRRIAEAYPSRGLKASAALATARCALLAGDLDTAAGSASAAVARWADLGAPFEAAVARLVLGDACHGAGNPSAAELEWRAAQAAFDRFGATRWASQAVRRLAEGPPAPTTAPPGGSLAVTARFRCGGGTTTISFAGSTVTVRELKGFRYVERLLADPGREFHVLDLVAADRGAAPARGGGWRGEVDGEAGSGLPVLDENAKAAYRRRLAEVDEDIEDAERDNDIARLDLAQHDREYIVAELARAVGLGGRSRTTRGDAERARVSVTRSIRYALGRLADHHPAAADHLDRSVRTGTYCAYSPDPLTAVEWSP